MRRGDANIVTASVGVMHLMIDSIAVCRAYSTFCFISIKSLNCYSNDDDDNWSGYIENGFAWELYFVFCVSVEPIDI